MIATLAVPRLVSALHLLAGSTALELVQAGARPGRDGLLRAIDAQIAALAALPRSEPRLNAAYLSLSLAESGGLAPAQQAELAQVARHHIQRALAVAPAQPRGWLMLAGIRLRDRDAQGAAAALALSFAANPHAPSLAPLRWPMALGLAAGLDRTTREQASLEFLSYFRGQPDVGLQIALRYDRLAELRALTEERGLDRDRLRLALGRVRFEGIGP